MHCTCARETQRGCALRVEQWGANAIKARARKQYVSPYDIATAISYSGDKVLIGTSTSPFLHSFRVAH
jgi:hypothetical protein